MGKIVSVEGDKNCYGFSLGGTAEAPLLEVWDMSQEQPVRKEMRPFTWLELSMIVEAGLEVLSGARGGGK